MKALIQRVKKAQVIVSKEIVGEIAHGLLVFLGIHSQDQLSQTTKLVKKIAELRIFNDTDEKMNLSVKDVFGGVLIVSQFTLYANCLNGRRPDFISAAPPQIALPIYEKFVEEMKKEVLQVQTGRFGAPMEVSLINEGPATFLIEM